VGSGLHRWWRISPELVLASHCRRWLINEQMKLVQAVIERPRDQTQKLTLWGRALAAIVAHESGQVDLATEFDVVRGKLGCEAPTHEPEARRNPARAMRRRQETRIR